MDHKKFCYFQIDRKKSRSFKQKSTISWMWTINRKTEK